MRKDLLTIMDEASPENIDTILSGDITADGSEGLSIDRIKARVMKEAAHSSSNEKGFSRGWYIYVAVSACLVILLSVGFATGLLSFPSENTHDITEGSETPRPDNFDDLIMAPGNDVNENVEGMIQWNGITMTSNLYDAIGKSSNQSDRFCILVRKFSEAERSSFVYNGKTITEWVADCDAAYTLLYKLDGLKKEGEELKYGDALYTTGTPSGERWAKELYDERISYYGSDFLGMYIVSGELLSDKIDEDSAALLAHTAEAEKYKSSAYAEYYKQCAIDGESLFKSFDIETVVVANRLYLLATEAQLASITLDNAEDYLFSLETKAGLTDQTIMDEPENNHDIPISEDKN